MKRAAKLHSTLTHRRSQCLARLDALLEILGPAWHAVIGADLANRTPLKFLAAGYADPHVVKRLGRTRLARFCYRHSRGAWGEPHADALLAAASQTLELWAGGELDYPDLAEDIAIEARLALQLTWPLRTAEDEGDQGRGRALLHQRQTARARARAYAANVAAPMMLPTGIAKRSTRPTNPGT